MTTVATLDTADDVNAMLAQIAGATRARAWVPDYQETVTDEEALGLAISNWASWDGDKIARVFLSALEDANFHTEVAQIKAIWNAP